MQSHRLHLLRCPAHPGSPLRHRTVPRALPKYTHTPPCLIYLYRKCAPGISHPAARSWHIGRVILKSVPPGKWTLKHLADFFWLFAFSPLSRCLSITLLALPSEFGPLLPLRLTCVNISASPGPPKSLRLWRSSLKSEGTEEKRESCNVLRKD